MATKTKSITAGQIKQIVGFMRDVLSGLSMGFTQVQAFISNPDLVAKFKEGFKTLVAEVIEINPFAKERVKQAWFYPKGWKPAAIEVQRARLAELFSGIDLSHVDVLVSALTLPKQADGIALFPKLSYLGKLWGIKDPLGTGYGKVLEKLFELISTNHSFYNYRKGELGPNYIRIQTEVKEQLIRLEESTSTLGDVLVLPFNFGNLYAGWSARSAHWEAINNDQLPLTSAHVAVLLLLMPDRLIAYEQLFIDCSGDEYDWNAAGEWSYCPYFDFDVGRLEFSACRADSAHDNDGSAVAFLGV